MNLKKILLSLSLILASGSIFGAQTSEAPVLVEHKTECFELGGVTHCIKITNRSGQTVVVDPSFVVPDLVSCQERARWEKIVGTIGLCVIVPPTLAAGFFAYSAFQDMKRQCPGDYSFHIIIGLHSVSITVGSLLAVFLARKLLTESQEMLEDELKKEMLHEPITIAPGQYVEKIFWLKNPTDHVTFNFDAVKTIS